MGITVSWDNPEMTIIRYDFEGRWTWGEFYAATSKAGALRNNIEHEVHVIGNFEDSENPPTGAVLHVRRALQISPKNVGTIIIAGGGAFINGLVPMLNMIPEMKRSKFVVAKSLDDAREMLTGSPV